MGFLGEGLRAITWNRMAERWRMCAWKIESTPVTPSARSFPALICANEDEMVPNITCT